MFSVGTFFTVVFEVLASATKQEKDIKGILIVKRNKMVFIIK
jgi:hypothetical protein